MNTLKFKAEMLENYVKKQMKVPTDIANSQLQKRQTFGSKNVHQEIFSHLTKPFIYTHFWFIYQKYIYLYPNRTIKQ